MNSSAEHGGSDAGVLVVDTSVQGSVELLQKWRNEGLRPAGLTTVTSNIPDARRLHYAYQDPSHAPDITTLRSSPTVRKAWHADSSTVRQHVRVIVNPDHPESVFLLQQLRTLGIHPDDRGVYAFTANLRRITAICDYLRGTQNIAMATRINPPFAKITPGEFGDESGSRMGENPETAFRAQRCILQVDCSTAMGSADLVFARLTECGFRLGGHSQRQTGYPDRTQLLLVLHKSDNPRRSFESARAEAHNQIGVDRAEIMPTDQHLQYVQGVVPGTIADVERFVQERDAAVRDVGGHVKYRGSVGDAHTVTGFAPVAHAAELAGKLYGCYWNKNGPVQAGLRRPYETEDPFRNNFGDATYAEFRRLMQEALQTGLGTRGDMLVDHALQLQHL